MAARLHGAMANKPLYAPARSPARPPFDGSAHAKTHGVRRGSSVPPPSQGFPPVKRRSLMRAEKAFSGGARKHASGVGSPDLRNLSPGLPGGRWRVTGNSSHG